MSSRACFTDCLGTSNCISALYDAKIRRCFFYSMRKNMQISASGQSFNKSKRYACFIRHQNVKRPEHVHIDSSSGKKEAQADAKVAVQTTAVGAAGEATAFQAYKIKRLYSGKSLMQPAQLRTEMGRMVKKSNLVENFLKSHCSCTDCSSLFNCTCLPIALTAWWLLNDYYNAQFGQPTVTDRLCAVG